MTVDKSTFINNTAVNGGAVNIYCYYMSPCSNSITNSYFTNNAAINNGGAINYNSYQPSLVNNVFDNNSAAFRPDMANYPIKLMMVADDGTLVNMTSISNQPSGLAIETPFKIAIVNNEEQIMTNQNTNAIRLLSLDTDTDVKGQTTVVAVNGVATFTGTKFIASPGRSSVNYAVKTKSIDYIALQYVDPQYSTEQNLTVSFRWCKPGEYQAGNVCIA